MDKLGQIALFGRSEGEVLEPPTASGRRIEGVEEDKISHAGRVLRSLNEHMVKDMCGDAVYNAGLMNYMQGRVSDRRFSDNTLSAKLNEGRKGLLSRGPQFFEPRVTLQRNSKKGSTIEIYGHCDCSVARSRNLCTHIAALMIAWVRKPRGFEEEEQWEGSEEAEKGGTATLSEFEEARKRVMRSLKELVSCIESSSSKADELEVLQKTYSKLRLWTNQVKEATREGRNSVLPGMLSNSPSSPQQSQSGTGNTFHRPLIHEFSATINSVSFAIMSEIESKYPDIGSTDLYNSMTVSTFAKVLESFVESASYKVADTSVVVEEDANKKKKQKDEEEGMLIVGPAATTVSSSSKRTGRSWDSLIDEFRSSGGGR